MHFLSQKIYLLHWLVEKFMKLDLSQSYLQLTLDYESRQYVTVNTHIGLYWYTCIQFGVALAPAIFQRFIDTILQNIPNVICHTGDILVSGNGNLDMSRLYTVYALNS